MILYIGRVATDKFRSFAANWGVPVNPDTLKMFLACACDNALHQTGLEELPDDDWDLLVEQATARLLDDGTECGQVAALDSNP